MIDKHHYRLAVGLYTCIYADFLQLLRRNAPNFCDKVNKFLVCCYTCRREIKKLIVSRQPIFVNLKSNTMKNTLQRYDILQLFARILHEKSMRFNIVLPMIAGFGIALPTNAVF